MNKSKKPIIYVNFLRQEILGETGRLLFSILNVFSLNEYPIRLFENVPFEDLGKYGQLSYSLYNLKTIQTIPNDTTNSIYLFDKEDKAWANKKWKKKIQVKFDIFSSYSFLLYKKKAPIVMPFPMHPLQYRANLNQRLEEYRDNKKEIRIFFSGDMKGYTKSFITYPETKMSRSEVIETILEKMNKQVLFIQNKLALGNLFNEKYINKCVIIDTNNVWVDEKDWLKNISKSDFFLCPPGICMPMCHNVIEAMAVGTIPIINYPEWFNPGLRHMENCIIFDTSTDLVTKIKDVLNMDKKKISKMRESVIDYYENYLNPESFISNIESREEYKTIVLMLTEKYVRNNALKFNEKSILLGNDSALQKSIGFKILRMFEFGNFLPRGK